MPMRLGSCDSVVGGCPSSDPELSSRDAGSTNSGGEESDLASESSGGLSRTLSTSDAETGKKPLGGIVGKDGGISCKRLVAIWAFLE